MGGGLGFNALCSVKPFGWRLCVRRERVPGVRTRCRASGLGAGRRERVPGGGNGCRDQTLASGHQHPVVALCFLAALDSHPPAAF
jgi:hypothetical protein